MSRKTIDALGVATAALGLLMAARQEQQAQRPLEQGLVYWRAVQTAERFGLFGETTVRDLFASSLSTAQAGE